jgi:hypothetical protein
MALHAPTHHAGITGNHRLMRDFLFAIGLAVALIVVVGIASTYRAPATPATGASAEAASLVEYRAGERADWAAGVPTEASSLIEFRAGERAASSDVIWTGQPGPR